MSKPVIDTDLTNKWLYRLRMTATTNEARDKLGQLSTILEYFNKPSQNQGLQVRSNGLTYQAINWEEWENELHTPGVVEKIKQKYENFMKAEYSVESAVSQVGI